MQACPYDALYINEDTGTAEKCHFCAHRTEVGLAPACAVVCPTEAIIPGDFDDPESRVSQMRAEGSASRPQGRGGHRAPTCSTGTCARPASIRDSRTLAGGSIWANPKVPGHRSRTRRPSWPPKPRRGEAPGARPTTCRASPDVGLEDLGYLFTKSLSAGVVPRLGLLLLRRWGFEGGITAGRHGASGLALFFLFLTGWLLVADLKRPSASST